MTIAELNNLYDAAQSAMDSGDWDTAITKLMGLQARLSSTPNVSRNLSGGGSQSISWNPQSIGELIALCRRKKAEADLAGSNVGPWKSSKVKYKRAT
jgi:hypothetical protein